MFAAHEEADLRGHGLGGDDRCGTGASVARWTFEERRRDVSAKIAIVACGEVSADAFVAGAMSARWLSSVLVARGDELAPQVAVL